jgi:hypothetical protein
MLFFQETFACWAHETVSTLKYESLLGHQNCITTVLLMPARFTFPLFPIQLNFPEPFKILVVLADVAEEITVS